MADLKIFRVDEYSWYVAHNLMEFLNWYDKNIDSITETDDLSQLEITEPEDGTMWSDKNITQEDVKKLGENDEYGSGEEAGDLKKFYGEIYKMQTFAEVLGDEDIMEPCEIASTEW